MSSRGGVGHVFLDRSAGGAGGGSRRCGKYRFGARHGQRRSSGPTTEVLAAGADDVSAAVAELFSGHAQLYQTLAAQASSFHDEFVKLLSGNGTQYASAEFTNAEQTALNAINAPAESIFDRPLIGNGANGATPGANGQDGGILWETAATAPPGGSARTAGTVGPAASCSATAATVARVAPRPSAATGVAAGSSSATAAVAVAVAAAVAAAPPACSSATAATVATTATPLAARPAEPGS